MEKAMWGRMVLAVGCLFAVLLVSASSGETVSPVYKGVVSDISLGDTLSIRESTTSSTYPFKLYGIVFPDKKQAFGKDAEEALASLLLHKNIEFAMVDTGKSRIGRRQALVWVDGVMINEKLLEMGLAWVVDEDAKLIPQYDSWNSLQETAKKDKAGLWADEKPVPPWEFAKTKSPLDMIR